MNLHEYQAKELLKKYNVHVQEGIACSTPGEAEEAYRQIKTQYGSAFAVVKAQIHAGGRGKGKIRGTEQRGVAVGKNAEAVKEIAQNILGGTLVTIQTGEAGKVVNKVLVAQDVYYEGPNPVKEFYLSILLDRGKGQNVIMYSTEGGMDIEDVAHKTPEKIFKEWVHPSGGLQPFQARKIAFNLGLSGESFKSCVKFVPTYITHTLDSIAACSRLIHCLKRVMKKLSPLTVRMNLDDNALTRHPDLSAMRDVSEEDPTE
jgi:succinyl-CoA synthetase beta subunit